MDEKQYVYAKDTYCDELFGEEGNYCVTDCEAVFNKSGELDLEVMLPKLIEEGWLFEDSVPNEFKVIETATQYNIYYKIEDNSDDNSYIDDPEFYVRKN